MRQDCENMGSTNERERIHEFVSFEARVAPTAIIEDARYRSTPSCSRSRGQSVTVTVTVTVAARRNATQAFPGFLMFAATRPTLLRPELRVNSQPNSVPYGLAASTRNTCHAVLGRRSSPWMAQLATQEHTTAATL